MLLTIDRNAPLDEVVGQPQGAAPYTAQAQITDEEGEPGWARPHPCRRHLESQVLVLSVADQHAAGRMASAK